MIDQVRVCWTTMRRWVARSSEVDMNLDWATDIARLTPPEDRSFLDKRSPNCVFEGMERTEWRDHQYPNRYSSAS